MKRIIVMILCLVLLGTVTLSVSAAGTAHMSISSSSGTVYRGDAFTLTVSLSNDQPISNGGIVLSYDSSVFELVGGSCNVSNATLAEVSAANGGGVFLMQTDTVVSGTIFTINMKVKSDAAFGTYTISGTPSLSIACGVSGTSVTVACSHAFGNCTKVDGSSHESTCSVCGEKKKEAHSWDAGTVTKAATCKETGSKTLKCTACGVTKAEAIPVTNDHKYGSWSGLNDSSHTHKCSVCGKEEAAAHTWNSGEVIEGATCQQTGYRIRTCTGCGASIDETIPIAGHTYGASTSVNDTSHTHKCSVCGKEETEDHSYDDAWAHDKNWHYQSCGACGYKKGQTAHVPGPKATETTDQVCTVCARVLQPMGTHKHDFAPEWSADETGHWHDCGDCDERDSAAPHEFDDSCDVDCNVCGAEREVTHDLSESWSADKTGHWYLCRICSKKQNFAAHVPGPEATISSNQVCTQCQFEIAPVVPHDHVFDTNGTRHFHECACGAGYEADAKNCEICAEAHKQFPWWIVCIAEAVAFGGVIALLVLRGRKKPEVENVP